MRRIVIGIGTTRPDLDPCIVCGCAAFTGQEPYPKTLNNMLEHVLCWTATMNSDAESAIKAVTWRLVEKLYLSNQIDSPDINHVRLLLKPRYRGLEFSCDLLVVRSHWLISASNMLLNEL